MDGRKDDCGKLQYHLVPIEALEEIIKVLQKGAEKYAPDNWKKVPDTDDRYYNAIMRHMNAWKKGEKIDSEFGISHLAHAGCSILFMLWLDLQKEKEKGDG